ncbi:MAG: hypothetical protein HC854_14020 [Flavobacterium sp.]|nr:hypothetical protein [Flavobacterium sp.]
MKKLLLLATLFISFFSYSQRNVLTDPDGNPIDIIIDPNDPSDPIILDHQLLLY